MVQHLELNRSGWHGKAIDLLVLTLLWAEGPMDCTQIVALIQSRYALFLGSSIERITRRMVGDGRLVSSAGKLQLSPRFKAQFEADIQQATEIQKQARDLFIALLQEHVPTADPNTEWEAFVKGFLEPILAEYGATLYGFIANGETPIPPQRIDAYLNSKPKADQLDFKRVYSEFLNPKAGARPYILRSLNAYFCLEATRLSENALTAALPKSRQRPVFHMLVDTNVLFYLLGLQRDQYGAVDTLLTVIKQLQSIVDVRLSVTPDTINEAQRTIAAVVSRLSGTRISPILATAARGTMVSSIVEGFFASAEKSPGITAEEYFGIYLTDFRSVLGDKGIGFYNESTNILSTDQDVVDDILYFQKQDELFPARAKSYEAWRHDVVLYHLVSRKRAENLTSPIDARIWLLTLDNRVLRFDRDRRRRSTRPSVPVCIDPGTLVQLLQFWCPRSLALDEAVVGALGLPFFQEFDSASEESTLKILRSLSRFSDSNQLSLETARKVLLDQALRHRLRPDSTETLTHEIVTSTLISESERLKTDFSKVQAILDTKNAELDALKGRSNQIQNDLEAEQRKVQALTLELGNRNSEFDRLKEFVSSRLGTLQESDRRSRIVVLVIATVVLFLVIGVAPALWAFFSKVSIPIIKAIPTPCIALFAGSLITTFLSRSLARGPLRLSDWPPLQRFENTCWTRIKQWWFLAGIPLLISWFWDWLKL